MFFFFPLLFTFDQIQGKNDFSGEYIFSPQINNSDAVHSQIHKSVCSWSSPGLLSSGQAQSLCSLFRVFSDLSLWEGQNVPCATGEHLWAERLTSRWFQTHWGLSWEEVPILPQLSYAQCPKCRFRESMVMLKGLPWCLLSVRWMDNKQRLC